MGVNHKNATGSALDIIHACGNSTSSHFTANLYFAASLAAAMSDEEDDYLSDKFLVEATASSSSSGPKTYADRRKEALKKAALKNEQNRKKSRRELEREAREEALNRSLFERAQEEAQESGQQNKALAMMMKMGFKPGQALGKDDEPSTLRSRGNAGVGLGSRKTETEDEEEPPALPQVQEKDAEPVRAGIGARPAHDAVESAMKQEGPSRAHRTVPLALNEWEGALDAVLIFHSY